jgi:hypothetical protein
MLAKKHCLAVSVSANIALTAGVIYLLINSDMAHERQTQSRPNLGFSAPATVDTNVPFGDNESGFNWRTVESPDYRQYIWNLRAVGCPEQTIKDIVTADVDALFSERGKALAIPERPYWQSIPNRLGLEEERRLLALDALDRERRLILQELLGEDAVHEASDFRQHHSTFSSRLTFLTPEKARVVQEIEREYDGLIKARFPSSQMHSPDEIRDYLRLQAEKERQIRLHLSEQEMIEYDVRFSSAAMQLRGELQNFEVSAEEFRQIVALRKEFEQLAIEGLNPDIETRRVHMQYIDDKMKAILGHDRYKDFQLSQNPTYQAIISVADQFGIQRQVATEVLELVTASEQAMREIISGNTSHTLPVATVQQLRADAEQELVQLMGSDAAEAFMKSGHWMRQLRTTPLKK